MKTDWTMSELYGFSHYAEKHHRRSPLEAPGFHCSYCGDRILKRERFYGPSNWKTKGNITHAKCRKASLALLDTPAIRAQNKEHLLIALDRETARHRRAWHLNYHSQDLLEDFPEIQYAKEIKAAVQAAKRLESALDKLREAYAADLPLDKDDDDDD